MAIIIKKVENLYEIEAPDIHYACEGLDALYDTLIHLLETPGKIKDDNFNEDKDAYAG